MSIAENIARVRANIAAAAREAGREASEVTLVGASKMNDAEACRAAIAAGIDALGENREQEMTKKLAEHAYDGAPLHFIGHLQRNKVKNVVGKVALLESVGSLELLAAVNKQAEKLQIVQDILLEVNIGGEEAKSGFAPEELSQAAQEAIATAHVVTISRCVDVTVTIDYPRYDQLVRIAADCGAHVADTVYTDRVTLTLRMLDGTQQPLLEKISELTRGAAEASVSNPFDAAF